MPWIVDYSWPLAQSIPQDGDSWAGVRRESIKPLVADHHLKCTASLVSGFIASGNLVLDLFKG